MMKIEEIWIYPIKSCAGYRVAESELQTTGLKHDRNWMLVDESGRFVSQRKLPSMARITAVATEDHLRIRFRHPSEKSLSETVHRAESWHGHWLEADLDPGSQNPASVSVWSDTVTAHCYPDDINSELSSWLGQTVRLVKMASSTARMRNKKEDTGTFAVSFADGYPVLLVNRASHRQLMEEQNVASPVQRFRANLITTAELPFVEESWSEAWSKNFRFENFKPCVRCVMIDVDQLSGNPQRDTLHLLADFRAANLDDRRVIFGMNMIPAQVGTIREGDELHAR